MGLDVVELVLECEQVFGISLDDHKLATTTHVGHLFELICTELHLPLATAAPPPGINRLSRPLDNRPWTRRDTWATLIGIFGERGFTVKDDQAFYRASLTDDLGLG